MEVGRWDGAGGRGGMGLEVVRGGMGLEVVRGGIGAGGS